MSPTDPRRNQAQGLFDLSGQRAIVTGASRGIGQAIAVAYAAHGAEVVAVARSESGLAETVQNAASLPGSITALAGDLSSPDGVRAAIGAAGDVLGGIDVLVNNAGYDNEQDLDSTTLDEWHRVMQLNVEAVFVACQAAGPLLKGGGGKVVNVASMLGALAVRSEIAYVTSKHAVVGFTRALSLEWARSGVQVNALGPGFVETEMLASATADEATAKFLKRGTPQGRWAQPDEMAGPAVFLASRASDFMTGQLLVVDGGWSAQ